MVTKAFIKITYSVARNIYKRMGLTRFEFARNIAAHSVRFMMMERYKIRQKPVWQMLPEEGTFRVIAEEEFYTVRSVPYWGKNLLVLPNIFRVPTEWHATICDASIHAPSSAVISQKILWQQEEATALPAFSSGYSTYVNGQDGSFSFYTNRKKFIIPQEAALIAHRTDFNYFHVMFEVIPKIIRLKEIDPEEKMHVLLNKCLNQNISDLLKTLIGKRPIIFIENLSFSKVKKVHLFSTPSFLPDDLALDIGKASISSKPIPEIQRNLLPHIQEAPDVECLWVSRQDYAEDNKKRGVTIRDIENIEQVNQIIQRYNAERFSPEKFSWTEQGKKFRSAKRIVMTSGSAVANLVYCKPGTRVLLMCKNNGVNPAVFFQIFEQLKIEHAWVLGDSSEEQPHAPFTINEHNLERGMKWLFEDSSECDGVFP